LLAASIIAGSMQASMLSRYLVRAGRPDETPFAECPVMKLQRQWSTTPLEASNALANSRYLNDYAAEQAWREDVRRLSTGKKLGHLFRVVTGVAHYGGTAIPTANILRKSYSLTELGHLKHEGNRLAQPQRLLAENDGRLEIK
jgi:hypothetical protein